MIRRVAFDRSDLPSSAKLDLGRRMLEMIGYRLQEECETDSYVYTKSAVLGLTLGIPSLGLNYRP